MTMLSIDFEWKSIFNGKLLFYWNQLF